MKLNLKEIERWNREYTRCKERFPVGSHVFVTGGEGFGTVVAFDDASVLVQVESDGSIVAAGHQQITDPTAGCEGPPRSLRTGEEVSS